MKRILVVPLALFVILTFTTASPSLTSAFSLSNSSDNYSAHLFQQAGGYTIESGTIVVDTSTNNGVLHMTAGSPNQPYTLQFCSYPSDWTKNCIDLATFTANAELNNTVPFQMPTGTWSGAFQVVDSTGLQFLSSGMTTTSPGLGFQSAMLPAFLVPAGIGAVTAVETGSGTMSTDATTLRVNMTGAKPNNIYSLQLCGEGSLPPFCKSVGTVTSNASGVISATADTEWELFAGEVVLSDGAGVEYISALRTQGPCRLNPTSSSVTICSPANGSTVHSPVTVTAGTTDKAHLVTSMIVYVDNNVAYRANANQLSTSLALSGGMHNITVSARDSSGGVFKTTVFVTVPGTPTAPVSVALMPSAATLAAGALQQFSATVLNTKNTAVRWSVDGILNGNMTVGMITNGGLYTAPSTSGTHRVTATSVADPRKSDTAIVTATGEQQNGCGGTSGPTGVVICNPGPYATVPSPVQVTATGFSPLTPITTTLVYLDGNLRFQTSSSSVNVSLPVADGPHVLTVQFFNGTWIKQSENFAVGTPIPPPSFPVGVCPVPQRPGVNVCAPPPPPANSVGGPAVIDSPFQVIASGKGTNAPVLFMELWADGNKVSQVLGNRLSVPVTLSSDIHQLSVVELGSRGAFIKSTPFYVDVLNPTVDACSAPSTPGVNVCVPLPNSCHTAGWTTIVAAGTGESGAVSRMELWINGNKVGDFPGNQIRTNLYAPDFSVMTVIEVDSAGAVIKSAPIPLRTC